MIKKRYKVIGVMSGTSLDGIDLAYISLVKNSNWIFDILKAETIKYSNQWYKSLKDLVDLSKEELHTIDIKYTELLAGTINDFIERNRIKSIDAICSHGHTALHKPDKGITYQIGNNEILAKLLNYTVVCDFRIQDVEFGGQGAPLVPIGDRLLFGNYDYCLNLGGFANISHELNSKRIAFDICPVNIVLNYYARKLNLSFDDEGKLAKSGKLNPSLLNDLNAFEFYELQHPKSLGIEWVKEKFIPVVERYELNLEDSLRTLVEHIAIQISRHIKHEDSSILLSGGGTFNTFLIERMKDLSKCNFTIPSQEIIDFKEALIFAFLGVLKLRNEVNCLSSVTGAKYDHSSGKVFLNQF